MKKLMAANWKMYKTQDESARTAEELVKLVGELPGDREVLICPPFTSIPAVTTVFSDKAGYATGGQNFYPQLDGAFTGEISPPMLQNAGCTYALAGHSERRHVFGEEDDLIARKVDFGLEQGLRVILCIGETLEERKQGKVEEVLDTQLTVGLSKISKNFGSGELSIAYEPVWAIGTGEVAGPEEITEAHLLVRNKILELYPDKASKMRILYGGSVKPQNCSDIMSLDNVDGVLVGGASLQAESFSKIVLA